MSGNPEDVQTATAIDVRGAAEIHAEDLRHHRAPATDHAGRVEALARRVAAHLGVEHEVGTVIPDDTHGATWHHTSLEARIAAVADAFATLTGERTDGPPLTVAEACRRIDADAGCRFDPLVAAALIDLVVSPA